MLCDLSLKRRAWTGRQSCCWFLTGMSAQADSSFQSLGTPDLSLGSLVSGISTPAKSFRVSSASSHTTAPSSAPISTPSPPHAPLRRKGDEATPVAIRRHIASREEDDEQPSDPLNASRKEDSWEGDLGTPLNTRGKRSKSNASNSKGNNLTLRDQEKVRNFNRLLQNAHSLIASYFSTSTTSRRRTSI